MRPFKSVLFSVVTAALLATTALPAHASSAAPGNESVAAATIQNAAPTAAPVYRFWSDTYNGHFYTTSAAERNSIIANSPTSVWRYEGSVYGAFTRQETGTVPLYRFWSDSYRGHFYTTSAAERDQVIRTYPQHIWRYEGIAYYVYPSSYIGAGTVPVARFWSDTYLHHFYTASTAEATQVKSSYPSHIWRYEIDGFRVPAGRPAAAPLPTTPAPKPTPTTPGNPGDVRNCTDFNTWAEANAWFQTYYPLYGDVARLDQNNDGIPCETLAGFPY
nr:excalibur calcium-binding domain-containing protein [Salinibacterium sp.]